MRSINSRRVDPARTYRVTGNRGDSVYLSMTVYGGPDDGRYSDRIVGTMNDTNLEFDADGNFAFTMSPDPQPGAWLKLDPDAVVRADPRLPRRSRPPRSACSGRSKRSTRLRAGTTVPRT